MTEIVKIFSMTWEQMYVHITQTFSLLQELNPSLSNFGKTWASPSDICDASAAPSGIKHEWYVCMLF
jgi:hypothetical protein